MSDETPSEKRCTKCGEVKPFDAFTRHKKAKDGINTECKTCTRQRCNAYNGAHKAEKQAYDAAYRAANLEKKLEYDCIYREIHHEEIRAYQQTNAEKGRGNARLYYAAHAKSICKRKRDSRATNPEAMREYPRRHRAANLDAYAIYAQQRRAQKKANGGTFTLQELKAMRAEQNGICAYCKRQYEPNALTIDHIIPIAQGGRHERLNICLACPRCNYSKNNRTPEQWTNRWYQRDDE